MGAKHARPVLARARELAAKLKALITCDGLHALCEPAERSPLMQVITPAQAGVRANISFGWTTDAEAKMAAEIAASLLEAEQQTLREVSTDALVKELKSRHDLFFMVASPNTPEDYQWRRSLKGPSYPLIGFVTMHVDSVKLELGASAGAVDLAAIVDDERIQRDDEDGPSSLGR